MQKTKLQSPKRKKKTNIVVLGGGTGSYTVLTGLKKYKPLNITSIVSMADDGGSTGILRDELGVLPPGDVRQCLVALSNADQLLRDLFNYRFKQGGLKGHNFGNLLITALEKSTGSFEAAVTAAAKILNINGEVIPVTLNKVRLKGVLANKKILKSEHEISTLALSPGQKMKRVYLTPANPNPKALTAIKKADMIVVGPGDLYGSILPVLLVKGIPTALKRSSAKKVYIVNLMSKEQYTAGFDISDFLKVFKAHLKNDIFDCVIYNNRKPPASLLKRYRNEGKPITSIKKPANLTYIGASLVNRHVPIKISNDILKKERTFIRHDPDKLAKLLLKLLKTPKK